MEKDLLSRMLRHRSIENDRVLIKKQEISLLVLLKGSPNRGFREGLRIVMFLTS